MSTWAASAPRSSTLVRPTPTETFVGDLVETAGEPQSDETTDVRGWPRAIDSVITGTDGVGVYVPGHGHPIDATAVMKQRAALAERVPVEIPLTPVTRHVPPQPA